MLSFVEKRLIEGAAADPEIRGRLLAEPALVVGQILDREFPANTMLDIREEVDGQVLFALPPVGRQEEIPEALTRRHIFENGLIQWHNRDHDGKIRAEARKDPRGLFRDLTGNEVGDILAEGNAPVLLEDGPDRVHIVLPQQTETLGDELPEDLLDYVSGGSPSPCNTVVGWDRYRQDEMV